MVRKREFRTQKTEFKRKALEEFEYKLLSCCQEGIRIFWALIFSTPPLNGSASGDRV
jgi:hypothetical protein